MSQSPDPGALCAKPEAVCPTCGELRSQNKNLETNIHRRYLEAKALRERNAEMECSLKIARHEWQAAQDKLAEIERNLIHITGVETDYATNIDTLQEQRDTALSELAACRKDKERLDWLESQTVGGSVHLRICPHEFPHEHVWENISSEVTVREAIDAARAAIPESNSDKLAYGGVDGGQGTTVSGAGQ